MKAFSETVHDFWFEPAPPARLAILRILVGSFVVWYLTMEQDIFMRVARSTDPHLFAPVGIVFGSPLDLRLFEWLFRGTMLVAICFTLGLWHRITGPLFAVSVLWVLCYQDSWSMIFHSMNLVALHGIVLGFTRSADALSLDAFLRGRPTAEQAAAGQTGWQYGWPIKLMCAVTVSAYLVTAITKLAGPLGLKWMTGRALRSQMAVDQLRKELLAVPPNPVSYAIYDWLPLFSALAVGSFALEFFAPLALFNRRVGRIWAMNAFLMHWGIFFVMGITFEYQLTGVIFASFFRLERLVEWPRRLWRKRATQAERPAMEAAPRLAPELRTPRATLFYDGECGLCDRFVQFVLRHDRREYFQFATLQSEAGRERLSRLGLSPADLRTVVLVEGDESYVRSTATLRVCRRLAGLWPVLYAVILVPKAWRDGVYSLIARHRKLWFEPPSGCPVMPEEWRRRFVG